jgi:hypothetical protein
MWDDPSGIKGMKQLQAEVRQSSARLAFSVSCKYLQLETLTLPRFKDLAMSERRRISRARSGREREEGARCRCGICGRIGRAQFGVFAGSEQQSKEAHRGQM